MDVSRPYGVISHPLDGAVLHVLTGTTQGMSGRRVAELTGNTQEGVMQALRRLVDAGIVEQQEAGNAILYRFNRRHLAAPAVEQLTDLRRARPAPLTALQPDQARRIDLPRDAAEVDRQRRRATTES